MSAKTAIFLMQSESALGLHHARVSASKPATSARGLIVTHATKV